MPGRDGTGPEGKGPRGRRMGPCRDTNIPTGPDEKKNDAGEDTPGSAIYGVGRGGKPRGCGQGFSGGRRRSR
ncbi:DUF5320 domain-containing protein [Methanocella paludicola]|uniref:DUF5320 domain-containing protein n=1 Tax=Methanocella paludicola TaxID=570267 RepID=UPI000FFB3C79|nr:DUF5320 domain-containing protein [Methanocella paludicola]